MFRSGGDEPEVELLGEDTVEPGTEVVTTERARTWWPVWLAAAVILGVGITAIASGSGGSGGDAASSDSDDPQEPAADPTPVPETTTTFPPTKVTVLEAGPPTAVTQTTELADPAPRTDPELLSPLGLDGGLLVWWGGDVHRIDLVTGDWSRLELDLEATAGGDTWSRALALSRTGLVIAADGVAYSLALDGTEIDRVRGLQWGRPTVTDSDGNVWILAVSGDQLTVWHLDAQGHWVETWRYPVTTFPFGASLVSAGGRLFTGSPAGGIFEISAAGSHRVADGLLITGGADRLLRYHCSSSLESCSHQWLSVPDFTPVGAARFPTEGYVSYDGGEWSPDLRFWESRWAGGIVDTESGDLTAYPGFVHDQARPSWSLDSRWVARGWGGKIHILESTSGTEVTIDVPQGLGNSLPASLLFVP